MHCHGSSEATIQSGSSIALIGHPNVGKSVIFQSLTGQQAMVSNYPGTTVEIMRGAFRSLPGLVLVDTPGVIAFPPYSEDEQVTARVLLEGSVRTILQVGDAKNLRRTLLLTVQLAEMGHPVVLALNMMDEARMRGVVVDQEALAECLSLPVVPTIAIHGKGIDQIIEAVSQATPPNLHIAYPDVIEQALRAFDSQLGELKTPISNRALGLLWLSNDVMSENWLRQNLTQTDFQALAEDRQAVQARAGDSLSSLVQRTRLEFLEGILSQTLLEAGVVGSGIGVRLGTLTTHPIWGIPVLLAVMYAMYWFVGIFGAGTLVGLLEENLFGELLNPWLTGIVVRFIPVQWLADLLVGEYGLWTMGMTYALALILPIVSTFFLAFGIMEDSGYLPRLAALSNRLFKALGLNGKAVLPMVLGLGCVTMATLTTRVLESKRERLLVTLLLALAVPCSAQLGVVMGMLAGISLGATLIWGGMTFIVLLAVGWLAAQVMPGERTQLLVELPPLRIPQFSNVILKTLARLEWYIKEVVPLFLVGTALMFGLDRIGVLQWLTSMGEPLVKGWLGLPSEASAAFLMGFLRRDFGATGLFIMQNQGLLSDLQVVVAMVTITLFVPCIASVMVIAKERGWQVAAGMMVFIFPLAFVAGGLLFRLLAAIGWGV